MEKWNVHKIKHVLFVELTFSETDSYCFGGQQVGHGLRAKVANSILCYVRESTARLREWHQPSAGEATHEVLRPVLGFWEEERDGLIGAKPAKGHKGAYGTIVSFTWDEAERTGPGEDSGGNLSMCTNTWWKGVKQIKPVVPTDRTRGDGQKLKHMKLYPTSRKKLLGKMVKCWNTLLRKIVVSVFGDIQNPTGHHSVQSDSANPA